MGDFQKTLELTSKQTEEHKHKRLTAKHEVMTILRKLEAEQAVTNQLKDVIKCTFVPKALSQQQLLAEGNALLMDCIHKINFTSNPVMPNPGEPATDHTSSKNTLSNNMRLISNLETETQKVSQNIMLLLSSVEHLQYLLNEREKQKGCVEALSFWLGASSHNIHTNIDHDSNSIQNNPNFAQHDAVNTQTDILVARNARTRTSRGVRKWNPKNRNKPTYGRLPSDSIS